MSRSFLLQVLDKEAQFLQASESGDVERVKQMVSPLLQLSHSFLNNFPSSLFQIDNISLCNLFQLEN